MIVSAVLQLVGLVGLPVGGFLSAGWGGGIIGGSVSAVYLGLAVEHGRR